MFHPLNPGSFVELSKHYEQNLSMYRGDIFTTAVKILTTENRTLNTEGLIKIQNETKLEDLTVLVCALSKTKSSKQLFNTLHL